MDSHPAPAADIRMRGFARRATVAQALHWLDAQTLEIGLEDVPVTQAAGRVLGTAVRSAVDVPGFDRAMMDGYAVRAEDTQGASAYQPLQLEICGESLPAAACHCALAAGQAVRIMTGAPIPTGADAVLPAEKTRAADNQVTVLSDVPPSKHVGRRGEDIAADSHVFSAGRRLRPQDVGVLCSIGVATVQVYRGVRVRIVATGNELLPPGSLPEGNRIVDSNSPMLAALVVRDGGHVVCAGIVPDEPQSILAALQDDVDVVLVSGGSSVGQEDHAPSLLAEYGELAVHGIAMRPSSPCGMGRLGRRLVFLLPGNPVSCLCAYDFYAGRALRRAAGLDPDWPYRKVCLPLGQKLVSVVGRVDYARVNITDGRVFRLAVSGASMLSSTTRADGFVLVPQDVEGYAAGVQVEVMLYD